MKINSPVSVVIATHNRASFIGKAIHSVLRQTAPDMEIIVVDDGSVDSTPRVLAQFGNHISIIRQPNQGRSAARNVGVRHASGDIIAFLDSDDIWLPNKLAQQCSMFAGRPEVGLVQTLSDVIDENGIQLHEKTRLRQKLYRRALKRGYTYEGMSEECIMFLSTVAVRRECWDRVGPMDTNMPAFEDWDWYLRVALDTEIATIPETLVHFRQHAGNTTAQEFFEGRVKTCRKHLALLDEWSYSSRRERARRNFYMQMVAAHYVHGSSESAGQWMRQAVRTDPTVLLRPSHLRYALAMCVPGNILNGMRKFRRQSSHGVRNGSS
ncbi:MAG: hypothetical protein CL877_09855 [Dehalococcoidales bacterium]|nr:hypothetical protein [Dehalococcoidales bacterium]